MVAIVNSLSSPPQSHFNSDAIGIKHTTVAISRVSDVMYHQLSIQSCLVITPQSQRRVFLVFDEKTGK